MKGFVIIYFSLVMSFILFNERLAIFLKIMLCLFKHRKYFIMLIPEQDFFMHQLEEDKKPHASFLFITC